MVVRETTGVFGFLRHRRVVSIQAVITVIVAWALLVQIFGLSDLIASPMSVGVALYQLLVSGDWIPHMYATLQRTLAAVLLTLLIGTGLGILLGFSQFWQFALQDYIIVGLASPTLLLAVFAAMWFGSGDATAITAATLSAVPFLTQSVYSGVDNLDRDLIEMSASFDTSRMRVMRRVIVPAIMPEWFGGVRYTFAICFKVTALAEVIAASNGLGYMIQYQLAALSFTGLITWVLLFTSIIVIVEYGVLQPIERHVFDWRAETEIVMA